MNSTPDIIAALREEIRAAQPTELPSIIMQLEGVKAEAWQRLVMPVPATTTPAQATNKDEDLLTLEEMAAVMRHSTRWVRDHRAELPVVDIGGRKLMFSKRRTHAMLRRKSYANRTAEVG